MNKGLHRGLSKGLKKEKEYTPFKNLSSVYFDGVNERIALNVSIHLGTTHTISFWMYQPINNNAVIIGGGAFPYYTPYYSGWQLWYRTATTFVNWTYTLPTNRWIHIVFSRNETSINLYVNAILIGNKTLGANEVPSITSIGSYGNALFPFNGYLNNLSFWLNVGFSQQQILEILRDKNGNPKDISRYMDAMNPTLCRAWFFKGNNDIARMNAGGTAGMFFVPKLTQYINYLGTGVNMDASNVREFVP